jgi:ferredoxin
MVRQNGDGQRLKRKGANAMAIKRSASLSRGRVFAVESCLACAEMCPSGSVDMMPDLQGMWSRRSCPSVLRPRGLPEHLPGQSLRLLLGDGVAFQDFMASPQMVEREEDAELEEEFLFRTEPNRRASRATPPGGRLRRAKAASGASDQTSAATVHRSRLCKCVPDPLL